MVNQKEFIVQEKKLRHNKLSSLNFWFLEKCPVKKNWWILNMKINQHILKISAQFIQFFFYFLSLNFFNNKIHN